jgi:hypothetical protein
MKRNNLVILVICGILVASAIFSSYEIGHNSASSNYTLGFTAGNRTGYALGASSTFNGPQNNISLSQASENYKAYFAEGNATGYAAGYQAGLKAQTKGTG